LLGTPTFTAPEQMRGAHITAASDVYAFGVVLYHVVTGTYPFVAAGQLATAFKRLTEPPTSPRVYVPDLEPVWERVILRCLEPDPADRFKTPQEVVAALDGETASARTFARHRWLSPIAIVIALFILGATSLAGFLSYWGRSRAGRRRIG